MLIFVSGGVRSGKSRLGERLVSAHPGGRRVYLATTEAYDEEMETRICLHQSSRMGKGFVTVERSRDIGGAVAELLPGDAAMLDCLGALAANEMFDRSFTDSPSDTEDNLSMKIFEGVMAVHEAVSMLVVVSNDVFSDGVDYPPMTAGYIRLLASLHRRLASVSDVAVECAGGACCWHKGKAVADALFSQRSNF